MRGRLFLATGVAALASGAVHAQTITLQDALATAYSTNPTLLAARAQLRSVDEGVPQALSNWRPTVVLSGSGGYADGTYHSTGQFGTTDMRNERNIFVGQATLTQPVFRGGNTRATTNQATNRVYAQRAQLMATEQTVFANVVNAYVTVIQDEQILALNINNEQVLARQLQATQDRFRVGEITRTDVAQAEAALAGARATRETAQGTLQTGRGNYRQYVGVLPDHLTEPQPLMLPVKNQNEAVQLAANNNPNVISALFTDAAARDNIDVQFSQLMPQVSIQALAQRADNSTVVGQRTIGGQVLANVSVPIYQGGAEYSRVRQARQSEQQARKTVDDTRRQSVAQATQAWETLVAARATLDSTRSQIRANQIALEGVQREAIVGSRTTLDVLNAQQALLNSQVTLVQNLANYITASYGVASAIGRLTARDLNLNVPLYDETAYYNAVKDRLWGTSDYATEQPGR